MADLVTYRINRQWDVENLQNYIAANWSRKKAAGTPLVCCIRDHDEEYTHAQRRLYFKWCHQLADHNGTDKDYEHIYLKEKFLMKIYYRDRPNFKEMGDAINDLKDLGETEYWQRLRKHVIKEMSITKATKAQMKEYLNDIFAFAYNQGIALVVPSEFDYMAADIQGMNGGNHAN